MQAAQKTGYRSFFLNVFVEQANDKLDAKYLIKF